MTSIQNLQKIFRSQSKSPPLGEWINKSWYIHAMKYYSAMNYGYNNIDGYQYNYAEWKKPAKKECILYASNYVHLYKIEMN